MSVYVVGFVVGGVLMTVLGIVPPGTAVALCVQGIGAFWLGRNSLREERPPEFVRGIAGRSSADEELLP